MMFLLHPIPIPLEHQDMFSSSNHVKSPLKYHLGNMFWKLFPKHPKQIQLMDLPVCIASQTLRCHRNDFGYKLYSLDSPGCNVSGQIIASHDLTPNGGLVREIILFQGNLGW